LIQIIIDPELKKGTELVFEELPLDSESGFLSMRLEGKLGRESSFEVLRLPL
jgi:hypothetical protein